MIDNTLKLDILNRILNSNAFNNADKYSLLLSYLVKSSIAGDIPKEHSIAIDVFERDKDFNPAEDTIVRYYMHRLRQKIGTYYEEEGKNESICLVIPKGHYEVKFEKKQGIIKKKVWMTPRNLILGVIFILLLFSTIFFFNKYNVLKKNTRLIEDPVERNDPIWSSFFDNKLPTTLLVGDHYIFQEYDKDLKRFRFIIDHDITLKTDFTRFMEEFPDRKLNMLEQGSLPLNSIYNLFDLDHIFYSFNQKVNIELTSVYMSSQFDLTKITDRNIIYVGGFRNLRSFSSILDKISVRYRYTPSDFWRGEIIVPGNDPDSLLTFKSAKFEDDHYSDLGLIAKIPGNKQENYLILTGFAFPAQIEIVRIFSRNKSLAKIYNQTSKQYKTFPKYFFMIIEVIGFEYSAMESRVIYFKEVTID